MLASCSFSFMSLDAFFYDPFTNLWSEVEFISFTSPNQTKEENKEVVGGSGPDSPPPPPTTPPLPPRHSHSICHYKDASLILSGGILNNQARATIFCCFILSNSSKRSLLRLWLASVIKSEYRLFFGLTTSLTKSL